MTWHIRIINNNIPQSRNIIAREAILYFFKDFIYLFLEREEGKEKETYQSVASYASPTGYLAQKPGMGPDLESNWQPFSPRGSAQTTEPQQSGW